MDFSCSYAGSRRPEESLRAGFWKLASRSNGSKFPCSARSSHHFSTASTCLRCEDMRVSCCCCEAKDELTSYLCQKFCDFLSPISFCQLLRCARAVPGFDGRSSAVFHKLSDGIEKTLVRGDVQCSTAHFILCINVSSPLYFFRNPVSRAPHCSSVERKLDAGFHFFAKICTRNVAIITAGLTDFRTHDFDAMSDRIQEKNAALVSVCKSI